ncbi:hypothetical protein [Bordetella bronchiseptica]|uniref:hypothetical protein n=1 Tax=Bordetella bronchiseptica TaxID=518 RepID=UPI001267BC91|nr:hypothetical protein [Bordetella bronchiseptica]
MKWLWIILQPKIEDLLRELTDKAGDVIRQMAERIRTRATVSKEMAKQAAARAEEAVSSDPLEAARQRGRQEAYEEMAVALGVDAEALQHDADGLRNQLLADGKTSRAS